MAKSGPKDVPPSFLQPVTVTLCGKRNVADGAGWRVLRWQMWVLSVVTRVLLKGGRWIFASQREERGCEDGAEIWRCCAAGLEDGRADAGHETREHTSRSWERPGNGFSPIAFWGAPALPRSQFHLRKIHFRFLISRQARDMFEVYFVCLFELF